MSSKRIIGVRIIGDCNYTDYYIVDDKEDIRWLTCNYIELFDQKRYLEFEELGFEDLKEAPIIYRNEGETDTEAIRRFLCLIKEIRRCKNDDIHENIHEIQI